MDLFFNKTPRNTVKLRPITTKPARKENAAFMCKNKFKIGDNDHDMCGSNMWACVFVLCKYGVYTIPRRILFILYDRASLVCKREPLWLIKTLHILGLNLISNSTVTRILLVGLFEIILLFLQSITVQTMQAVF